MDALETLRFQFGFVSQKQWFVNPPFSARAASRAHTSHSHAIPQTGTGPRRECNFQRTAPTIPIPPYSVEQNYRFTIHQRVPLPGGDQGVGTLWCSLPRSV